MSNIDWKSPDSDHTIITVAPFWGNEGYGGGDRVSRADVPDVVAANQRLGYGTKGGRSVIRVIETTTRIWDVPVVEKEIRRDGS